MAGLDHYHIMAGEYDEGFLKKYGYEEDLDTTLIL
jgi:hypothetical protein